MAKAIQNINDELHELVEDYMKNWCGVDDMYILHEEIDNPELRSDIHKCFMEYVERTETNPKL